MPLKLQLSPASGPSTLKLAIPAPSPDPVKLIAPAPVTVPF
jgi:hypothetical protein